MGVKKKEKIMEAVILKNAQSILESNITGREDCFTRFLTSHDSKNQLKALKECSQWLRHENDEAVLKPVISAFVMAFLQCHPKNQLRRALTSTLQSVQEVYFDLVQETFKQLLSNDISDHSNRRHIIDNMAAMLENFPLGEAVLISMFRQVLPFLMQSLSTFYQDTKQAMGEEAETVSMHNCLSTTQFFNKLLQKVINKMSSRLPVGDNNSASSVTEDNLTLNNDPEIVKCLIQICHTMWTILNEVFLLDCCTASGMSVPLILKCLYGAATLDQMLHLEDDKSTCSESLNKPEYIGSVQSTLIHPQELYTWTLPVSSHLCVLGGLLAMLTPGELAVPTHGGGYLVTDIICSNTLKLTQSLQDTNTKLMASRTVVLLTHKLGEILKLNITADLRDHLKGDSALTQNIIAYAWNHWEDPIDTIRHQTRQVFQNVIQSHLLATGEVGADSPFIHQMAVQLLSLSWHTKGRYGPLCCIVQYVGARHILVLSPDLPRILLTAMGEQALAPYVSELYEKLYTSHKKELNGHSGTGDASSEKITGDASSEKITKSNDWLSVWVEPILEALCETNKSHKTYIIEYMVPKLLQQCPDSFQYIIQRLTGDTTLNKIGSGQCIGALVTCLKQAKLSNLLKKYKGNSELWNGVISMDTILQALCHRDDQVRLDSFALLCDNHKTTEVVTLADLDLVMFFLQYNLDSQSPGFRQHLVALLKKLFIRLRDGGRALSREYVAALKMNKPSDPPLASLRQYGTFLHKLCDLIFDQLHPGAAFPRRTTALSVLAMMVHIMGTPDKTDPQSEEFHIVEAVTPRRVQILLECLSDTFEHNKMDSFTVLSSLPTKYLNMDPSDVEALLSCALSLACTTRPQDCTTAAYLLKVALLLPETATLARGLRKGRQRENTGIETCDTKPVTDKDLTSPASGSFEVVSLLLEMLQEQVGVARGNLLHAAATQPMYPVLHCIRYQLTDVDLKSQAACAQWGHLVGSVISLCFDVAEVVSPVVKNSSPEGNVPAETLCGTQAPEGQGHSVVQSHEDEQLSLSVSDSVAKVTHMPEYLVVCCWRSIKEVSLLLGQLTQTAPLVGVTEVKGQGHITMEQLHTIGQYFTTQLLESRHRGAFELAYAGFVKMTDMLWRCPLPDIHRLPREWLRNILDSVSEDDHEDKLCATRRSAGVPFYIQALVSTEPATTSRPCLKMVMERLLKLAWPKPGATTQQDNIPQVHALNILRALFRDTRLGEDVFQYIAEGLQVAALGYASKLWSIRNSSTLLFSALMTRIFGVKRTKDELSRKNCMTGRVFFHRFPSLHSFLKQQLDKSTQDISPVSTSSESLVCQNKMPESVPSPQHSTSGAHGTPATNAPLHPDLYPVLLVLGRLYPSVIEGADSSCNLKGFLHPILRCAYSPVYKTRMMAARALGPLVGKEDIKDVLSHVVNQITDKLSQNALHGILLQIEHLLLSLGELPRVLQDDILNHVWDSLTQHSWILSSEGVSYLVKSAYLQGLFVGYVLQLSFVRDSHRDKSSCSARTLPHIPILTDILSRASRDMIQAPGAVDFLQHAARCLLWSQLSGDGSETRHMEAHMTLALKCEVYEVRAQALDITRLCATSGGSSGGEGYYGEDADGETDHSLTTSVLEHVTEGVKDSIRNSLNLQKLFVAMVMEKEDHPECLEKALVILASHRESHSSQWAKMDCTYTVTQMLQRIHSLSTSHPRDYVRCAALRLTSTLMEQLYTSCTSKQQTEESHYWVEKWISLLEKCCGMEQSTELRLGCSAVVMETAKWALLDPAHILGTSVFRLWLIAVRLVQDEDVSIRHQMSLVLNKLAINNKVGRWTLVHPGVVLPVMIKSMMETHWSHDCLSVILAWLTTELEPDWLLKQDQVVRLFDRGEMNTYKEDSHFVKHLAHQLVTMTTNSQILKDGQLSPDDFDLDNSHARSNSSNMDTEPGLSSHKRLQRTKLPISSECVQLLRAKHTEAVDLIMARLTTLSPADTTTPLLSQGQYEEDREELSRLEVTLRATRAILLEHDPSVISEASDKYLTIRETSAKLNIHLLEE